MTGKIWPFFLRTGSRRSSPACMPHHHAARTRYVDGSIKDLGQCEVKPCEQDEVGAKRQGGWADHDSLNRDVRPVLLLSIADRGGACVGCVRSLGRVGGSERVD
ncbi:uncharacterized protein PITG_11820 [Phytophthora infestans T30-4]|uniref:Uncharacterized protein n=1 Tax=Phytophthora infestans (strain T30-4) TaxID=403677 RepID=D0NHW3_PHYIT|nr:uncharacterized protein PITG_11820 [Phytophthora infestans T30-4]EEY58838.1 hypothetical protein PITG_11820 [Phytophthora infestans T30-4]|eukprot:XP_002901311.1 hypothetical protein PITG_11820 [Phytophthora infestans T30-4]